MRKDKVIFIRVTEDQDNELKDRAAATGFENKIDYIKFVLLTGKPISEKIDKIYEKMCEND